MELTGWFDCHDFLRVVCLEGQGDLLGLVLYCKLSWDATEAFSGFPSVLLRAAVRWMSSALLLDHSHTVHSNTGVRDNNISAIFYK